MKRRGSEVSPCPLQHNFERPVEPKTGNKSALLSVSEATVIAGLIILVVVSA